MIHALLKYLVGPYLGLNLGILGFATVVVAVRILRRRAPRHKSFAFRGAPDQGISIHIPIVDGKCGYCGDTIQLDGSGNPYCHSCLKGLEEIGMA